MFWVRIDNRLVHGQIIETWIPYTGADMLLVASDELAEDELRQEIMSMAIPQDVELHFSRVTEATAFLEKRGREGAYPNALVLFATCPDARRAVESGLDPEIINIGNLHYSPGKKQLCPHVALSGEDEHCLSYFADNDIELDYRCVPNEPVQFRRKR